MKVLSYSGESVVTTDGVGDAVVDYTRALIADNSADVVDIPVVLDDQERVASIMLGPSSPLLVMPSDDADRELADELTIARLHAKIEALVPHQVVADEFAPAVNDGIEFDYL
jgi:hypothetical protein